jgi:predicted RNase H-like HicB family nuclease
MPYKSAEVLRKLNMQATHDHYTYRQEWSSEDDAYIARCLEFPSLATHGPSPEAALSELRMLVTDIVTEMRSNNEGVPEPLGIRTYSGKLVLRLPKSTHRDIAIRATEEEVSINQFLLSRLG